MSVERSFIITFKMLKEPYKTLEEVKSETTLRAVLFLLIIGSVTALLTPAQIYMGFEDVNGLHAGGQAEYLARDLSALYGLGIEWRPLLVELLYVCILLLSTGYIHVILKAIGGRGSAEDTLKMIAFGDAPALLFGWIPYFATISAVWAGAIQLLLGPVVMHKLSWGKAAIFFGILLGLGIIDISLSLNSCLRG